MGEKVSAKNLQEALDKFPTTICHGNCWINLNYKGEDMAECGCPAAVDWFKEIRELFSVFVEREAVLWELWKNRPILVTEVYPREAMTKGEEPLLERNRELREWLTSFEKAFDGEDTGFVVVPRAEYEGLKETCKILSDKPLMDSIRKARKKGSKSSPYKPLGVSGDVMEIKLQKCCCCGNEMILEPNGLCRVCSEECTKETLKDKPLATCGDAEK